MLAYLRLFMYNTLSDISMTEPQSTPSKPRAPFYSDKEKLHIANVYSDKKQVFDGAFVGASKSSANPKQRALEQLAKELTAMGVAKRTAAQVQQKIDDMKKKARKRIGQEVCSSYLPYF